MEHMVSYLLVIYYQCAKKKKIKNKRLEFFLHGNIAMGNHERTDMNILYLIH